MRPREPRPADGIRCRACGAFTPVLSSEPHCLYCSRRVVLPEHVRDRAEQVEMDVYVARGKIEDLDDDLSTEAPRYALIVATLMVIGIAVGLALWVDLLDAYHVKASFRQLVLAGTTFLGPLLFWLVASGQRFDEELMQLAKLSFAHLAAEPRPGGRSEVILSCSGCGGVLDASRVDGLTIRCAQCDTAMLAPASCVEHGRQSFHRKIVALRRHVVRRGNWPKIAYWTVGVMYVATVAGIMIAHRNATSELDLYLVVIHGFSFGMFMFWFFTVEQDGWDYLGAASGAAGFPLGALAGLIFGYMEMIAKAP